MLTLKSRPLWDEHCRKSQSQWTAHNLLPEEAQTHVRLSTTGTREFFLEANLIVALCSDTSTVEWEDDHVSGMPSEGTLSRNMRDIARSAAISSSPLFIAIPTISLTCRLTSATFGALAAAVLAAPRRTCFTVSVYQVHSMCKKR